MVTFRTGDDFRFLVCTLLICVAVIYGPPSASAQTIENSGQQRQEAQRVYDISPPLDPASEDQDPPSTQTVICGPAHLGRCLKDVALDQAGIWTSPLRLQSRDALWLLPFAGATAVAIHYDARAHQELGFDQTRVDASNDISLFGSTYATLAESGALYFVGRLKHSDHLAETGRLHAIGSWALARVIASEYPNKLTQVSVYAFATAISVSRVTSLKHFPSDALVGSVFGYLIGGYVVRHHAKQNVDSGFSFIPVVDLRTHTYGASVEVHPDNLNLANLRRLAVRLHPN